MSQLKMYWKVCETEYPKPYRNFTFRKLENNDKDIKTWITICRNGIIRPDEDDSCWQHRMLEKKDFKPDDVYFVLRDGEPVATITAIIHPDTKEGYVHMVTALPSCRGQAVGGYMNEIAKARFYECGCEFATLTTDEFRVAAIKSYLRSGFIPVDYDEGMEERWIKWLTEYGYSDIDFINEETKEIKILNKGKFFNKLKVGIFGARRGCSYAQAVSLSGIAYVSAVCDMDTKKYDDIRKFCCNDTKFFTDFDEFIDSGMDIVILANFFHKHAEFAIKSLKKGIHVLSETLPATTMKECVELCEAFENSDCKYMLAENYAYYVSAVEMKKVYSSGRLGKVIYAEGEYVHPMSVEDYRDVTPYSNHWRAMMPSCYYLSHSLAPLMYITESAPVSVNAQAIYSDEIKLEQKDEPKKDAAAIMLCRTNTGAIFRITGWAKFATRGDWYRIACSDGEVESVRGNVFDVRLCLNEWTLKDGEEKEKIYPAQWESDSNKAAVTGHDGSDFFVTKDFLECVKENRKPFFDVYKSCAMAATGILAWRSCIEHGKEFNIPDFKNKAERAAWKDDNLSPFPDENGKASLPCTIYNDKN